MLCMLDHNASLVNTSVGTNVLAFVLPVAHHVKELPEVLYRCPDDPCVITYHGLAGPAGRRAKPAARGTVRRAGLAAGLHQPVGRSTKICLAFYYM